MQRIRPPHSIEVFYNLNWWFLFADNYANQIDNVWLQVIHLLWDKTDEDIVDFTVAYKARVIRDAIDNSYNLKEQAIDLFTYNS